MKAIFSGTVDYARSLLMMEEAVQRVKQGGEAELLLLEHNPVITLGRSANEKNLLLSPDEYKARGIDLFKIGRGGDVTFHGPGQLVGYPIVKTGRKVKQHVMEIFDVLQDMMAALGVVTFYDELNPGLWTQEGKLASVGIQIKDGISRHGFALNIRPDFRGFQFIIPCGLNNIKVKYLQDYLEELPSVEEFAQEFARRYCAKKQQDLNWI
ncbi:MAG: lipoyl(octanoyl) transferase LipB [Deltaproteobacteria bacterium]|jgi:lipoyl(octanoyl) transferase|nr:lipoyl(octanoyl) transferase LipB [Deltaproteobacteria bacterium]